MPDRESEIAILGGTVEFVVADAEGSTRLDLVAVKLTDLSRSRLQALIRAGEVQVDGQVTTNPGAKVKAGAKVTLRLPEPAPAVPQGETIPLDIVYEDAELIVIDKPAGLVVHPAAGHEGGTLVNALIAHCGDSLSGIGGVKRPGIVHRLDKDTSGLLVVAKTDRAHRSLAQQFAAHGRDGRLERRYLALVWGELDRRAGRIDVPLARSSANRMKITVMRGAAGRAAATQYVVQKTFGEAAGKVIGSLVELTLETGRTHQIRVHMAHIGHPVMGDPLYATGFKASVRTLTETAQAALDGLGRQALHAAELGFEHPVTRRKLHFTSPLPADIVGLIDALEGPGHSGPAKVGKRSAAPARGGPPRRAR